MNAIFLQQTGGNDPNRPATHFDQLDSLNASFQEILDRPSVEKEVFLPDTLACWELNKVRRDADQAGFDVKYTLGKSDRKRATPTIVGVRLQERDPNEGKSFRERSVQSDLVRLVQSVDEIRRQPRLEGTVLSDEWGVGQGSRPAMVQTGPIRPATAGGRARTRATSSRRVSATSRSCGPWRRARFKLEPPSPPYDPTTGMKGLAEWADHVRLLRTWPFNPWLLLLLLLFLPLLWAWNRTLPDPLHFLGMDVKEDSVLILVDRSPSMEDHMSKVRAEVDRLLDARLNRPDAGTQYCDIILYDGNPTSILGGLKPLNKDTAATLSKAVHEVEPGDDTRLEPAMDLAVAEIKAHGKPTTVLVLSDGEDETLPRLIAKGPELKQRAGVPFTVNATTPRLFNGTGDPTPTGKDEPGFAKVPPVFGGRFGPAPGPGAGSPTSPNRSGTGDGVGRGGSGGPGTGKGDGPGGSGPGTGGGDGPSGGGSSPDSPSSPNQQPKSSRKPRP